MNQIDIFNGDADGICALLQLRLEHPCESTLVTGVKRDINLLQRVEASPGDQLTVLDISMAKNSDDLNRLLEQGAEVLYVDHHLAGDIPDHPALTAVIDTDPGTCTSLLVDQRLGGRYRDWAVAAAFGDNLNQSALQAAESLNLTGDQLEQLKMLGICINYNGYGSAVEDLHFPPDQLYLALINYGSPFDFINDPDSAYSALNGGYRDDLDSAEQMVPEYGSDVVAVYLLPDEPWSRRINGVFGNQLANETPGRAHAVVSYNRSGGYLISVRAPLANRQGAGQLCSQFPSGGGREGAAGINHLPKNQLDEFVKQFDRYYR
ncbi:MAG: DHH family phosphoesterase [Gammaproteobacteria bacterium]|nr:DHH family phosphoesterase [Gammaproteobacteria bacterium]